MEQTVDRKRQKRRNLLNLEHFAMQAPPSHTAAGQHLDSVRSSSAFAAHRPRLDPPQAAIHATPGPLRNAWTGGLPRSTSDGFIVTGGAAEVAEGIGLAHDAGNLLGAIRLYCDLLALPGVLRSEHRHYADELRQLTARSGSLIGRLLRPDPLQSGLGDAPVEASTCPAEVVAQCRGTLDAIAAPDRLLVAVEWGGEGAVAVPREDLERILVNLLKNAAEAGGSADPANEGRAEGFGDGRGAIAVRVRPVADWGPDQVEGISVSVEDRGRGMDETALSAALSGGGSGPASAAEQGRPGRGIGLRVVRELTARTGGELRMRSRVGQGTTVEIVWAALPDTHGGGAESG